MVLKDVCQIEGSNTEVKDEMPPIRGIAPQQNFFSDGSVHRWKFWEEKHKYIMDPFLPKSMNRKLDDPGKLFKHGLALLAIQEIRHELGLPDGCFKWSKKITSKKADELPHQPMMTKEDNDKDEANKDSSLDDHNLCEESRANVDMKKTENIAIINNKNEINEHKGKIPISFEEQFRCTEDTLSLSKELSDSVIPEDSNCDNKRVVSEYKEENALTEPVNKKALRKSESAEIPISFEEQFSCTEDTLWFSKELSDMINEDNNAHNKNVVSGHKEANVTTKPVNKKALLKSKPGEEQFNSTGDALPLSKELCDKMINERTDNFFWFEERTHNKNIRNNKSEEQSKGLDQNTNQTSVTKGNSSLPPLTQAKSLEKIPRQKQVGNTSAAENCKSRDNIKKEIAEEPYIDEFWCFNWKDIPGTKSEIEDLLPNLPRSDNIMKHIKQHTEKRNLEHLLNKRRGTDVTEADDYRKKFVHLPENNSDLNMKKTIEVKPEKHKEISQRNLKNELTKHDSLQLLLKLNQKPNETHRETSSNSHQVDLPYEKKLPLECKTQLSKYVAETPKVQKIHLDKNYKSANDSKRLGEIIEKKLETRKVTSSNIAPLPKVLRDYRLQFPLQLERAKPQEIAVHGTTSSQTNLTDQRTQTCNVPVLLKRTQMELSSSEEHRYKILSDTLDELNLHSMDYLLLEYRTACLEGDNYRKHTTLLQLCMEIETAKLARAYADVNCMKTTAFKKNEESGKKKGN